MNFRWNPSSPGFGPFDVVLAILLGTGCILSLPIYGWLFGTPFVRLWKCWLARRRETRHESASPPRGWPRGTRSTSRSAGPSPASALKPPGGKFDRAAGARGGAAEPRLRFAPWMMRSVNLPQRRFLAAGYVNILLLNPALE